MKKNKVFIHLMGRDYALLTDQVIREAYVETYGKTYEFTRLED